MTNDTCLAVRADLVAFLDEELESERATAIRAHLSGCAGCQAERDALDGAWKSLDLLPGLEPREGLFAEIEARVLASESTGSSSGAVPRGELTRFPAFSRVVGIAAAALLTAGVGVGAAYLLKQSETPERSKEIAVQPAPSRDAEGPAPIDMGQAPELPVEEPGEVGQPKVGQPKVGQPKVGEPGQRQEIPRVKIPRVKVPVESPPEQPESRVRPEVALASAEWDALDPEEREVVENLELLISLDEVDDLEVIETLEVLDDLTDEELGEG